MVLIIDVIEPHLIVEDVDEGDLHPWKIIYLRHNKVNQNLEAHVKCF